MSDLFSLLIELLNGYASPHGETSDPAFILHVLQSLDQILGWEFSHSTDSLAGSFAKSDEDDEVSLSSSFPESWREVFDNCNLANLFSACQIKAEPNSLQSHHAMQCLVHLSGVCGPVFNVGVTREELNALTISYLDGFLNEGFFVLLNGYFFTFLIDQY